VLTVGVGGRPGADLAALVAEALAVVEALAGIAALPFSGTAALPLSEAAALPFSGTAGRSGAQDWIAVRPDAIATIDRRTAEAAPVAAGYGCPLVTFTAEELAAQPVPAPSQVVAGAVGTASVAEAAALLAAGPGARLLVGKRGNGTATVAVAVR
jgi:hypothetical protein